MFRQFHQAVGQADVGQMAAGGKHLVPEGCHAVRNLHGCQMGKCKRAPADFLQSLR